MGAESAPAARIAIAGRPIGLGHPVYVIAEVSANHGQDYATAERIVRAAASAGADAVKFQTYTPDTITIDSDAPPFRAGPESLWSGTTLYDLYRTAYTPWEWQPRLKALADDLGVHWFSSAFDATAVDFLVDMDVPAFKVASFELVDLPLIRRIAATGRPLILSTGMATQAEIDEGVAAARAAGAREIALLKASSAYPAPPGSMHLAAIPEMAARYGVPIGLSDHTVGTTAAVAAVAMGACIVEKHIMADHEDPSPDAAFSLDATEFAAMVDAIRFTEQAIASAVIEPAAEEHESRRFRRSLFVVEDMAVGEAFTETNVRSIRPGDGLHTREYDAILGRRAARAIERGTPLSWDLIAPEE